ncbi:unnamed protein product [Cunninghamella blakesleeana]
MDPIQEMRKQVCKELQGSLTIVVLGASGDLAKKKTYPALFRLYRNGFLPENTYIVGYARSDFKHDDFISRVTQYIKIKNDDEKEKNTLESFKKLLSYQRGSYDKDESFQQLDAFIKQLEQTMQEGQRNRLFYMALPPTVFVPVARGLKKNVYATQGVNRIVVEKPFGKDLASSNELAKDLGGLFAEKEIFRIDHYLGKEMGGYFDEFGIIRDVMQNHLLQILSLIAMERPISTNAEAVRDEKVKVLKCIPPIDVSDALLGQYVSDGKGKPGYLEDDTLTNKASLTPTFAALVLWIQNERWEGVPFILKAGKALNEAKVEVRIQFRNVAGNLYKNASRNELVIRVQPDEALYTKFNNKLPGLSYQTIQTDLDLTYNSRYVDLSIPDAYESLILDVLRNDHSNFVRDDELSAAWKIFTPLLHKIDQHDKDIEMTSYPYGSRGPEQLDQFIKKYGYDRSNSNYEWPVQSVLTKKN